VQINLTHLQAQSLIELLGEQIDGEDVLLTKQGLAVYVAFSLASYTISADGEIEEAG
jgi:hypothetical protein